MDLQIIIIRFAVVFILSSLFGIERQRSHKPIGFATFIFVAVGSCGLALISVILNLENPSGLLSAIITGIGFLGAGALIKTTDKIFGFNTAASIWIFAIFGLTIGIGQYIIGSILYLLIWLIVFGDRYLEKKGIGSYQKKITVVTKKIVNEKDIKLVIQNNSNKCKLLNIEIDKKNNKLTITYLIEAQIEELNKVPQKLFEKDWFSSCKIE